MQSRFVYGHSCYYYYCLFIYLFYMLDLGFRALPFLHFSPLSSQLLQVFRFYHS